MQPGCMFILLLKTPEFKARNTANCLVRNTIFFLRNLKRKTPFEKNGKPFEELKNFPLKICVNNLNHEIAWTCKTLFRIHEIHELPLRRGEREKWEALPEKPSCFSLLPPSKKCSLPSYATFSGGSFLGKERERLEQVFGYCSPISG